MFPKIELAFEDFDVAEVTPADVDDFVRQWSEKPRQGNKYRHLLSMLFKFACAPLRLRTDNPCDQVGTLDEGPEAATATSPTASSTRSGARRWGEGQAQGPSGDIIVCAMDLAYLTFQRQFEIRTLRWSDMDDEWLYFKPAKSKSTTGAKVRWKRTPEIDAVLERARAFGKVKPIDGPVIHTLRGKPYSKRGFYTAWERACERAKVNDAHFHDLRAKAQTDAKARGLHDGADSGRGHAREPGYHAGLHQAPRSGRVGGGRCRCRN
jgi:integrase